MGILDGKRKVDPVSSGGILNRAYSIDSARNMEQQDQMESQFRQQQSYDEQAKQDEEALRQQRLIDTDAAFRKEQQPYNNDWLDQNAVTRGVRDYVFEPFQQLVEDPAMLFGLPGKKSLADNPISQAFAEYTVPDAPYLNEPDAPNARDQFLKNSGQVEASGVSKFIGQAAAPFFVPGAGLGTGNAATEASRGILAKVAPRLGGLGQTAAREAITGGLIGAGSEYAQGEADPTQALITGGLGAAGGALLPVLGRGISAASRTAGRELTQAVDKPSLGNAVNDFIQRVNTSDAPIPSGRIVESVPMASNSAVRQAEENFDRVEAPTTARIEPKNTYYADRLGELFSTAKQEQLPPGREHEALEDIWSRMAGPNDPSLDELIDLGTPTLKQMERTTPTKEMLSRARSMQAQKEVAGVPLPVKSEFDRALKFRPSGSETNQTPVFPVREIVPNEPVPIDTPKLPKQQLKLPVPKDELGFAQTVKASENTPQPLTQAMNDSPMLGARTSDVINRQQAEKLIEKHGREGLYSKLLAKRNHLSSAESTAAQMLAKQYASEGGKENLSKSIALVSKSAREGREMGQAIQALTQWNKLDETGALLMGERQLNRGVSDTAEWKSLTTEQAAPLQEAAQRVGKAQETKSLADEVLSIVTTKKPGEALSEAEKDTIKQFQTQVKEINEKTKGFLPKATKAADVTIKEVGEIKPKERTRDQVVNFLDAKAEKARQRLANQSNIGFAAQHKGNPAVDYAIIGAAKVAKGVVKFADFTEQMVKEYGAGVKPLINEVYHRSVNMFRREHGLPTIEELDRVVNGAIKRNELTGEEAYRLKAWANEIGFMSDNFKVEATQDLQLALKELGSSTLGEKLSTMQTAAQLLNAVTIGRNIIGNAAQIALEKVNKVTAIPIDMTLSKLTGNERTIQFFPKNQEKFWLNFMAGTKSGWNGVSPTGTLSSYDIHPDVFSKKNPLRYLSKALGATLQGFDYAAYRSAYGDVVATYAEQMGKAQGLTKEQIKKGMPELINSLDERIHELADKAGLYATFQDETLLSRGADMIKKGLNKPTDALSRGLVDKGVLPKSLSMEGFGAGDIVLKYARTPANLIMRAVDYSPIGIIRSTLELAPLLRKGAKFDQAEATRAISRTITGSLGLTGMGYLLADAGILTGSSSMDKDERSIQEQSGQGAYKVNWSALGRFIMGGLDKEAATYQKGDRIMDYAWLQPAAVSVAMGVNANRAVRERKEGVDISGWQIAGKALLGGLQSVLENPMVQGVSNVVDAAGDIIKRQDATKLGSIAKGVPASFIPTLSNQARTATDNSQRETYADSLLTEMGNLIKNKIPGLSKTLPVSYDSLGKSRERIQGGQSDTVRQYLTSFFSPARMTEYQVTPEAKTVLDLMKESGDKNVLPRINDRTIQVDNPITKKQDTIKLTPEQFSRLQKQVGEEVTAQLRKQADYLSNPSVKTESKVKRVKDILSDVGSKVRNDVRAEMGYKKKAVR